MDEIRLVKKLLSLPVKEDSSALKTMDAWAIADFIQANKEHWQLEARIEELERPRSYHIDERYSGHHHDGFRVALEQVAEANNVRIKELKASPSKDKEGEELAK